MPIHVVLLCNFTQSFQILPFMIAPSFTLWLSGDSFGILDWCLLNVDVKDLKLRIQIEVHIVYEALRSCLKVVGKGDQPSKWQVRHILAGLFLLIFPLTERQEASMLMRSCQLHQRQQCGNPNLLNVPGWNYFEIHERFESQFRVSVPKTCSFAHLWGVFQKNSFDERQQGNKVGFWLPKQHHIFNFPISQQIMGSVSS